MVNRLKGEAGASALEPAPALSVIPSLVLKPWPVHF